MRSVQCALGARSLSLIWLMSLVAAQVPSGSSVSFAYPPKATTGVSPLTINHVDSVVVQWTSTFDQAWLWLFCNTSSESNFAMVSSDPASTSGSLIYSAAAQDQFTTRKNWTSPLLCHFDLNYKNENGKGINGPIISVVSLANKVEATTYSLGGAKTSSIRSTLSTSTSRSTTTTRTTTPSPSNSSNASRGGGISGGAIAGIVIGAIAGIVAIAGLVFLLLRNHRKMKEIESKIPRELGDEGKPQGVAVGPSYQEMPHSQEHDAAAATKYAHQTTPASPRELEPTIPPQELPGSFEQQTRMPQERDARPK